MTDKESTRGLGLVGSIQLSIMTIMQVVRTESPSPLGSRLIIVRAIFDTKLTFPFKDLSSCKVVACVVSEVVMKM